MSRSSRNKRPYVVAPPPPVMAPEPPTPALTPPQTVRALRLLAAMQDGCRWAMSRQFSQFTSGDEAERCRKESGKGSGCDYCMARTLLDEIGWPYRTW